MSVDVRRSASEEATTSTIGLRLSFDLDCTIYNHAKVLATGLNIISPRIMLTDLEMGAVRK